MGSTLVRGRAAEFGVIAGKGAGKIVPLLLAIEQEVAIPPEAKEMFAFPGQQIDEVDSRIKDVGARLTAARKAGEVSQRLETIPGLSYAKVRKTTRALVVVQAHDFA